MILPLCKENYHFNSQKTSTYFIAGQYSLIYNFQRDTAVAEHIPISQYS